VFPYFSGKTVQNQLFPFILEVTKSMRQICRCCFVCLLLCTFFSGLSLAQPFPNKKYGQEDKFRQLEEILPTPNGYRSSAGEPGPDYWQQKIDYNIDVTLNDADQSIQGSETIRYHNQSPHTLRYLWLQLDANIFKPDSVANLSRPFRGATANRMPTQEFESMMLRQSFDGSFHIESVTDGRGAELQKTIVDTMMRIDLGEPLPPGQEFSFKVRWNYKINPARLLNGRTGYEFF